MSRQCSAFDCHLSMSKLKKLQIWRSIKCIICFSFLVTNYTNRIFDHLTMNERYHQPKWGVMKSAAILDVDSERRQNRRSTDKNYLPSEKYSFLCQHWNTVLFYWSMSMVNCRLHFSYIVITYTTSLLLNTNVLTFVCKWEGTYHHG